MQLTEKDKAILNNLGIQALILCGSRAQNLAGKDSDYDFLVLGKKSAEIYDALYDILSEKINSLTDMDIVFEVNAPLEFKQHVCRYGKILFEKHPNIFADFRQKTMLELSDFSYYRSIFSNATLSRIK